MTTDASTTQAAKSPHTLIWIAAIAVILFSAAGIAAIMGWIPTSMGRQADSSQLSKQERQDKQDKQDKQDRQDRLDRQDKRSTSSTAAPTVAAKPRPAASAPAVQSSANPPVNVASTVSTKARCPECGVIESTREVDAPGQGSAIGMVGGAVVGGLLGNQVGSGSGNKIATVAGAVGGAVAGNEIEKRVKTTKSYETTVRLEDGSTRVVSAPTPPTWRSGDRVKVVDGVIHSNP